MACWRFAAAWSTRRRAARSGRRRGSAAARIVARARAIVLPRGFARSRVWMARWIRRTARLRRATRLLLRRLIVRVSPRFLRAPLLLLLRLCGSPLLVRLPPVIEQTPLLLEFLPHL